MKKVALKMKTPVWNGTKLEKHTLPVFAFASGDINYFKISDEHNFYYERAWAAKDIYLELENRIDRQYLEAMLEAIESAVNKGKLTDISVIVHNAKQRMRWITHVDTLYKLASVVYFDENESPYTYDDEYNYGKIEKWKKDKDIYGFFLKIGFESFLPSFNTMKQDTQIFTSGQRIEDTIHLSFLLQILSRHSDNADITSRIQQRVEDLQSLSK